MSIFRYWKSQRARGAQLELRKTRSGEGVNPIGESGYEMERFTNEKARSLVESRQNSLSGYGLRSIGAGDKTESFQPSSPNSLLQPSTPRPSKT